MAPLVMKIEVCTYDSCCKSYQVERLLKLQSIYRSHFQPFFVLTVDHKAPINYGKGGSMHSKDRGTSYQNEVVEPCNFSSSIHYGGQEVYSPNVQSKNSHSAVSSSCQVSPLTNLICMIIIINQLYFV